MARKGSQAVAPAPHTSRLPTLPFVPIEQHHLANGWPPLWWVGAHGGAGTTTLAAVTGLGVDIGAGWPTPIPGNPPIRVVLVCRASASGALAATGAVEQWRRQPNLADTKIVGVVSVAASARKPPRRATERLRMLSGWVPAWWQVGWIEEYLAADHPRTLGMSPDVATLHHALSRTLSRAIPSRSTARSS
jgi:hypothetical protein